MYEVIVGNIGRVYQGGDGFLASDMYHHYMAQSVRREGRAANEPVTLLKDGEIVREYNPTDEAFDEAIDNATHAVIEAFKAEGFDFKDEYLLSDLMVKINDAIAEVMRGNIVRDT